MRRPGAATCPLRAPHLPQCRRRRVMVYVTPCRPHIRASNGVIHSPTRPPARPARKLLRRQRPPSRGQIPSLYGTKPLLRRAGGGGGTKADGWSRSVEDRRGQRPQAAKARPSSRAWPRCGGVGRHKLAGMPRGGWVGRGVVG